ncbi:MAG: DUF421 domain-containing protein [Clostridia bacterium]|nr:DUF421 domain-containing protein [Clostridia bacterium]
MQYLQIIISSIVSIIVLFLLTKLMGNKQLSQLNMFDYITGITIGSIAAEMATDLEKNPLFPILAMAVYGVTAYLISVLCTKSVALRKIFAGRTILLYDGGKFYKNNFKKARIDLSDFLTLCRVDGYFDLSQIQTAILEHNGNISFLPICTQRPATPNDLNLSPEPDCLIANVIMDGHIMNTNLKIIGKSEDWLEKQLKSQGYKSAKEVYLATCDKSNNISIYTSIKEKKNPDLFE